MFILKTSIISFVPAERHSATLDEVGPKVPATITVPPRPVVSADHAQPLLGGAFGQGDGGFRWLLVGGRRALVGGRRALGALSGDGAVDEPQVSLAVLREVGLPASDKIFFRVARVRAKVKVVDVQVHVSGADGLDASRLLRGQVQTRRAERYLRA